MNRNNSDDKIVASLIFLGILFIISLFFIIPQWNVWRMGLLGEAELNRAVQTKQIIIQQAQAELDSASLRAQAIEIVGQAAKDYPEYRKQEFIGAFAEALQKGTIDQIIYVPTEASVPILEAGKR